MTRKLTHHQYERLKSLAADLIEDYELTYPLQPLTIADLLGIRVTVNPQGLPAAAWFCDTDDGYTEVAQSSHGLKHHIHLNGTKPPLRQRFTTMHEVGHVWADHLRPGQTIAHETAEGEANFLASYLLAPDALAMEWVPDMDVRGIADVFQMSEEAARIAHGRVMRVVTNNVPRHDYDQRIIASAHRRIDSSWTETIEPKWGSA